MMQFLSEEAALVVARRATGSALVAVADAAYHFLQPGRGGPFVAQGEVLASTAGLDVAVELRDQGQDGRVCSLSYLRVVTED
jgi:acyl-coenzyme A thioesterase PaaI-like protein